MNLVAWAASLLGAASFGFVGGPARTLPPSHPLWNDQLQPSAWARYRATGGIDVALCTAVRHGCAPVQLFEIDLYGPDGHTPNTLAVLAIERAGGYPVCYVDAGTWENWRPDAESFPPAVLGLPNGWPGERWLDVRALKLLLPIMAERVAVCAETGFRGVVFDNVDGFENRTGFPITYRDQLLYDEALARIAHRYGLAAGLQNDAQQAVALEPYFDFAAEEDCVALRTCLLLEPFLRRGKLVLDVEYGLSPAHFCTYTDRLGIDAIAKAKALFARPWQPCLR